MDKLVPSGLVSADLARLAEAYGIATAYESDGGRRVLTSESSIRVALDALGVPAGDDEAVRRSVQAAREEPWRQVVRPTVVARQGDEQEITLAVRAAARPRATLVDQGGDEQPLPEPRPTGETSVIDGSEVTRWRLRLPADLTVGDHRILVAAGEVEAATHLVVAPARCPLPERRGWGWMLQLYATRSAMSWGMGDLGDLASLARWSGLVGVDLLLVNPLHAATPGLPQEPSPYFPSSRRFVNPLYLRIEDVPELRALPPEDAQRVAELAASCQTLNRHDRVNRDAVYRAKLEALELLHAVRLPPARAETFAAYQAEQGRALVDFATFCALAEQYGPAWRAWPAPLQRPDGPGVEDARRSLGGRVTFHAWVQWLADTQLAAAQRVARESGLAVGVIADLAVGVHPEGADAWALQDDLASSVTVGAPPDLFSPKGQDWRLPPLLPTRLADSGYAPFRELLRASMRHAGGIRVDHILGLFRLWWIPNGSDASEGTYVRYPARDLLNVLALEAQQAGAVVIGEDLGTVESTVRTMMRERGLLGSRVVWFQRYGPEQRRARAAEYPELALTSVTTHDLPTGAGYWSGEATRIRSAIGLLGDGQTRASAEEQAARDRAELEALLRDEGLVTGEPSMSELVLALQRLAGRTPSRLVAIGLGDAIADPRQPNMPGTTTEYPNWCLPLHDPATGRPALLEELLDDPRVHWLVQAMVDSRAAAETTGTAETTEA